MANLTQNEICAVLCSKRQYNQMTEKKWLCEVLHIAGLLNSENPIQIQIETFIKHVSPAKLMAIHVCQRDQERDIHYMTINKYDIT